MGARMAKRLGMSRRRFFQTAAGMAAAFVAMNETYGPIVRRVAAPRPQTPEMANERAKALAGPVHHGHAHRTSCATDTRIMTFVNQRNAVGKAGWNPALGGKEQTIDDLMFPNYLKEIFLDSDTKVACISGAPLECTRTGS